MRVSVITVVKNGESTIESAIKSLRSQTYKNIEHIIVDGNSTDKTSSILKKYSNQNTHIFNLNDKGIYDAINKGIRLTSGDIIGLLHSDDLFYDRNSIRNVVEVFNENEIDLVYGDLIYVNKNCPKKIVRRWIAGPFEYQKLKNGWMPPHPTVFLRKKFLINKELFYDTSYEISSDYDLLLRVFNTNSLRHKYLPKVLVKMRLGGKSNADLFKVIQKSYEDFKILRKNNFGFFSLFLKNFSKLSQFF